MTGLPILVWLALAAPPVRAQPPDLQPDLPADLERAFEQAKTSARRRAVVPRASPPLTVTPGQPIEFLGPAAAVPDERTPRGILYNHAGFNTPRPILILQGETLILSRTGRRELADAYHAAAHAVTDDPDGFAARIDDAYDKVRAAWLACGGAYARTAEATAPGGLYVRVRSTLLRVHEPPYFDGWAAGMESNGRTIDAVNVYVDGIVSSPQDASLRTFDALLLWEMGNLFGERHGLRPARPDEEIGSRSPCTRAPIQGALDAPSLTRGGLSPEEAAEAGRPASIEKLEDPR